MINNVLQSTNQMINNVLQCTNHHATHSNLQSISSLITACNGCIHGVMLLSQLHTIMLSCANWLQANMRCKFASRQPLLCTMLVCDWSTLTHECSPMHRTSDFVVHYCGHAHPLHISFATYSVMHVLSTRGCPTAGSLV